MKTTKKNKWEVPEQNGAPLLTMPNIPLALHNCNPRTIMGTTEWNKTRTACYEACERRCEVCGVECPKGKMDCHELYAYDYPKREAKFIRLVGLCKKCHAAIHSGRALTQYQNHAPLWTKEYMLDLARHAFELVHNWNKLHDKPLRLYETFLDWLDEPSLHDDLQALIDEYEIEFWGAPNRKEWENDWANWKMVYDGTEYYGLYTSRKDWEEKMAEANKQSDRNNLFSEESFAQLETLDLW